jgi:hypothetical protein
LRLIFFVLWLLDDVAENLELAFVEFESFLSIFHPFLSELLWIFLSEGRFERMLASCTILTVAQEVKNHMDNFHSS